MVTFSHTRQTSLAHAASVLHSFFAPMALDIGVGCITEKWVQGSRETSEPPVGAEWDDPDDPDPTPPIHKRGTLLGRRQSEPPKTGIKSKFEPVPLQAAQDKMPDASDAAFKRSRCQTNPPQTPAMPGIPWAPEIREDMPERFPNHAEDPSISFKAWMNATSLERQRDVHCFIVAFTRTVASSHPSLVSWPSLAAIAARFLPSAQDPSSSVPTLLDPASGTFSLLPDTHPCAPVSSVSLELRGTQAPPSSRPHSWRETPGEPKAIVSHGLP